MLWTKANQLTEIVNEFCEERSDSSSNYNGIKYTILVTETI